MVASKRIAALFVLAAGCAAPTDIGTTREAIVGGTVDTSAHDAVVRIVYADGSACSGTLLAPNLVLTARHCVSVIVDDATPCSATGTTGDGGPSEVIASDLDPTTISILGGVDANTSIITAGQGMALVDDAVSSTCHDDLALLVLAAGTTLPYVPVARTAAAVGDALTLVGYGLTTDEPTDGGSYKVPAKRQVRTGVDVLAVGPAPVLGGDTLGPSDFAGSQGNCEGDSGGPAFAADGSVVGVVSHGDDTCAGPDAVTVYVDATKHGDLIARAFTAAGYPGGPPAYVAPKPAAVAADDSGCNTSGRSSWAGGLVLLALLSVLRRASLRRASGARASRPCRARSAAAR